MNRIDPPYLLLTARVNDRRVIVPARPNLFSESNVLIAVLLIHIAVAPIVRESPILATLHALAVLLVGFYMALTDGPDYRLAVVLGYIAGSEVLWRMSGARVFWEYGKYGTILLILIFIWRSKRFRVPLLPVIYMLMLLPALFITLQLGGLGAVRNAISYNLSGPFSLFMSVVFFTNLRLTERQLQRVLLAVIAPSLSIASIALFRIATHPNIVWIGDSNPATSGGYGPNQVSTSLGMGLLAAWIVFFLIRRPIMPRILFMLAAGWLAMQTLLTFSRGGMLAAAIGILITIVVMFIRFKITVKMIALAVVSLFIFQVFLFPQLDAFTGGALGTRYANFSLDDTSGRDAIANAELQVFNAYPLFGVGVGQARHFTPDRLPAHTEYTRLLAEHGSFGILSLALLVFMGLQSYARQTRNSVAQAIIVACVFWTLFYMTNAAMRTVAPAFIFGLAFAQLDFNE